MEECKLARDCVLFSKNLANQPEIAYLMRAKHCRRDFQACALYMIAAVLGPERVPDTLFPNQIAQARSIIEGAADPN